MVHDNGVDGPEEDADKGNGNATTDEGGDKPDHEFESTRELSK